MGIFSRRNKIAWIVYLCSTTLSHAQTYSTLVTFNGANGSFPVAPLVQGSDGNYYGTTSGGGAGGGGTIFRMTPGAALTTLYTFTGSNGVYPSGAGPGALVRAADGNFYGTTGAGGSQGFGTVFKVTPSGALTTLYSFGGTGDGAYPNRLIQASDGNFYGITPYGGANFERGTIFKITPSGTLTTIYSFQTDLQSASSLIQGADGILYGTIPSGGSLGGGAVFKLTLGGTLTTLYDFGGIQSGPGNIIQGHDGNFYGTTYPGGGLVFKITPAGAFTILSTFASIHSPMGSPNGLMQASDGNFYGTTYGGGDANRGVVFEVTPLGAFRALFSFPYGGGYPTAGLVQGSDGNLYGTTSGEGFGRAIEGEGTVFRVPLPAYTCTNTLPPVVTSVTTASSYGGYPYFAIGSWLEIKGTNLADPSDPRLKAATNPGQWTLADFDGANAPTLLDGISASFIGVGIGQAGYISYLSPTQINVQVPRFYSQGPVSITVTNCNATSSPFSSTTQMLAPGFLAPPGYSAHGTQYLVATFASDGA